MAAFGNVVNRSLLCPGLRKDKDSGLNGTDVWSKLLIFNNLRQNIPLACGYRTERQARSFLLCHTKPSAKA